MRKTLPLFILLAASPLAAQNPTEYMLYGGDFSVTPSRYEIRRTVDMDADGLFLSAGEGWQFAFDNRQLIDYVDQLRFQDFQGVPAMFGVSAGDVVVKMIDLDADGVALSLGELVVFADHLGTHGGVDGRLKSLDFDPLTLELYVSDDYWVSASGGPQPGSGITRYTDLDNDGVALSAGEAQLFVDGQGTTTVTGIGGVQITIGLTDIEAIMVDSNGAVIGFEQQDLCLYAFRDGNGDGDAMDLGEAWNFCNLVGDVPGLELNADVAAGVLPNPSCPSTGGTGLYATLEGLNVDHGTGANGGDVYWIASTASTSCTPANGMVFRGEDLNQDGDLNDAGEVILFLDPNTPHMLYPPSFIHDAASHDGGLSIFQKDGPFGATQAMNAVFFLKDQNGDGDASDAGEQELRYAWDPDGCFGVSLAAVPVGAFAGYQGAFIEILGVPGTTSAGLPAQIGHVGLPWLGQSFQVTLTNGLPGGQNFLLIGWSDSQWNAFTLPLDLGPYGAPNNWLYVSVDFKYLAISNAGGLAAKTIPVPNNAALDGRNFYMQWQLIDPLANPRGWVTSDYLHGIIH